LATTSTVLQIYSAVTVPKLLTKIARWLYKHAMARNGDSRLLLQTGALPWRLKRGGGKIEIMLVTGRGSGRWLIPKGWPIPGKSLSQSAAQEAYEEAGVRGSIDAAPIGAFRHVKQHPLIGEIEVNIYVHSLAVEEHLDDWPERGERDRSWFKLSDAAKQVDSDDLGALILSFGKQLQKR
jgi:8-oxo-dGTP pyrophosphatase MutT (NUDIX family)